MTKLTRWFMCAGLAAAVLAWMAVGGVRADDEARDDVKAKVSGKIMIIGPDGKRQEFDLGDKLPKEMQERIQLHMKQLDLKQLPKCDACVGGKITIVGPDGKKREIKLGEAKDDKKQPETKAAKDKGAKTDKKDGAESRVMRMGRVVVIGPDGKRREFDMGEMPKIEIDQILPKDLDLPDDIEKAIREQLKGIELPRVRERFVPKGDASPKIKEMQRQIKEMQKQIDELKKRLDEKEKAAA